jgi:flavin reductase (DIM6/NTAB) family NADH-FMN oxidoreductase RutF
MTMETQTFRRVLGCFASGIAIITARDGDSDVGMTVSAFCSVSLSPPLVLVCISRDASMHDLMLSHPKLGISIMASEHEGCCRKFADKNEKDRFDGVPFTRGESSVMLLDDAMAHLECHVVRHHEAGDHTIFIAEAERGSLTEGRRPLLHYRGSFAELASAVAATNGSAARVGRVRARGQHTQSQHQT